MSTIITTTRRRETSAPTTLRTQATAPPSFIFASDAPTGIPLPSGFIELDTSVPIPYATIANVQTTKPATSVQTCSTDNDCVSGKTCANRTCVSANEAAPLGGSGAEPTSHLSAGAAIGVVLGVLALVTLLSGLGFLLWRRRPKPLPKDSIEAPSSNRDRSASSATGRTIDNDQRTLVGSLPNSPRNGRFGAQNEMAPEFFAKALEFDGSGKEMGQHTRQASLDDMETEKALPLAPTDAPLPPPPAEEKRYALNVNIDKSMMFDEDISRATSPAPDCGTPRERGPRYRFEEYLPPVATTPPISVTPRPTSSKRNSEYELKQYPATRSRSGTASTTDNGTNDEPVLQSPRNEALSILESKPPQIPPPDMPPPSPSFSFRSYDWYQDIISDQNAGSRTPSVLSPSPARTPTQATFLHHRSSNFLDINASLFPEPPSHLHPNTAALPSPTAQSFRLSPNVYEAPSPLPKLPPIPATSTIKQSRVSGLSTMTKKTHNSRSWLPEEGLYLPEDGSENSFKKFRRPSDPSRPMSYSPLT